MSYNTHSLIEYKTASYTSDAGQIEIPCMKPFAITEISHGGINSGAPKLDIEGRAVPEYGETVSATLKLAIPNTLEGSKVFNDYMNGRTGELYIAGAANSNPSAGIVYELTMREARVLNSGSVSFTMTGGSPVEITLFCSSANLSVTNNASI